MSQRHVISQLEAKRSLLEPQQQRWVMTMIWKRQRMFEDLYEGAI